MVFLCLFSASVNLNSKEGLKWGIETYYGLEAKFKGISESVIVRIKLTYSVLKFC
jgi:hypothetical protein